jgi:ABC-2 type transport system permease protein
MRSAEIRAAARLDLGEALRSRWLVAYLGVYAVLGAAFLWVGLRESSVLGFTGIGRVLFSLSHAVVLLLPLLALLATGPVVPQARADGSLELFLSQPIGRSSYLIGISLVRWAVLVVPLAAVLTTLTASAALWQPGSLPWGLCTRALAICVALITSYVGVGIAISVLARSPARATVSLLGLWLASAALIDFAGMALLLQWRVPASVVFALAVLNPVQSARLALLSAAEPTLGALGPVGFYLANQLGSPALLAIGVAWPVLLGLGALALALACFRRGDAI